MFVCYWVCNELFSIPLIPSESKLIGTPLFNVVTSNSEILILLLLYYSQSFGYILIKEVKNDCAHKHVRVHESARGSNRAKFWIGLLACLCVFLIQWHILWRIETLAATSMILLVKFVASYMKFHKSSCFSIESVFLRLTRVVIEDAWWICVWETGHHDVKNHLWWFSACHKADTIHNFFRTSTRHQHQSWRERWMTRENLFTHVFEWNFIFKVALLFVGCSFSNQREIWEMLGVEFTIFSQRIIASLTFWSRFKKLFYFDFIVVVGSCFDQLSSLLFSCPSRSIPTYLTDWVSESSKKKVAVLLDFVQMRGGGEGPAQIFRQLFTNCI